MALSKTDKRNLQYLRLRIKDLATKQKALKGIYHMPHGTQKMLTHFRAFMNSNRDQSDTKANASVITAMLNLRLAILGKEYRHGHCSDQLVAKLTTELACLPKVEELVPQS